MNATEKLIDAIQHVTSIMQTRIEKGERSPAIDAHDLIEVLLVIAERLEEADATPARDVLPTDALAEIARADLDIPDLDSGSEIVNNVRRALIAAYRLGKTAR